MACHTASKLVYNLLGFEPQPITKDCADQSYLSMTTCATMSCGNTTAHTMPPCIALKTLPTQLPPPSPPSRGEPTMSPPAPQHRYTRYGRYCNNPTSPKLGNIRQSVRERRKEESDGGGNYVGLTDKLLQKEKCSDEEQWVTGWEQWSN